MINNLETRRQIFHACLGITLALLIYYQIADFAALLSITAIGIVISYISRKKDIPLISWFLDKFEREEERRTFPGKGTIYYFFGTLITYGLFITQPDGKNIVAASLIILAIGDAIPHFVAHLGKIKHPLSSEKYIEANTLGAMLAFTGAVWLVRPLEALLASFAAMLIEGIDLKIGLELDDNITVPVIAGTVIWILRMIL